MNPSNDTRDVYETFNPVDFAKIKVGVKTLEDAIVDVSTYKKLNPRLGDKKEILKAIDTCDYETMRDISNFFYFPTDCPHREKNGWTADAALSAEQMLFNLTPENSYHVWMDNIRKAQLRNGKLPGIVPTAGWGYEWCSGPAWDSVLFYIPYYTWIQRGDTDIIKENTTDNQEGSSVIISSDPNISNAEKQQILTELDEALSELLIVVDSVTIVDETRLGIDEEVEVQE